MNRVVFRSVSVHWETPKAVYNALDAEFHFVDDPCPLGGLAFGLTREWHSPCFVNPPFSRREPITPWLEKAHNEAQKGKTVVCLIPSRTDTRWWHDYVMKADEIRFLRGRLPVRIYPERQLRLRDGYNQDNQRTRLNVFRSR